MKKKPKRNEMFDYKSDALRAIMDLLTGESPRMIELFFIPEYSLDFGMSFLARDGRKFWSYESRYYIRVFIKISEFNASEMAEKSNEECRDFNT